jgi:ribosome maturation factor RimP
MNEKVLTSVRDWLDEKFETEETFHDCYLVDLTLAGNKLTVFVDADEGLSLKRCQQISRFLEERIEAGHMMPEKYILEVSSPGVDRPLLMKRQYVKNIGRSLKVELKQEEEGRKKETVKGVLTKVGEETITLEYEEKIKEGKKKKKIKTEREIPFSQIDRSKVLISFK